MNLVRMQCGLLNHDNVQPAAFLPTFPTLHIKYFSPVFLFITSVLVTAPP
jgi:hypothetical protein